jgi:hypothetical protein
LTAAGLGTRIVTRKVARTGEIIKADAGPGVLSQLPHYI